MKDKYFANKTIIVTGASSGIGKAVAEEMAKRGANVVLAARNKDNLNKVVNEINKKGFTAFGIVADVSKREDCKNLVDKSIDKFGGIDILINNAGISMRALFEKLDLNVFKTVMDTNFWGTVYCTKYSLPYILKKKGSIVGVSSIAGYIALPGRTAYSASKFAMHGFLEALRNENRKKKLHVMIICPGFTATNIRNTALTADGSIQKESPRNEKKMMQAKDVALALINGLKKQKKTVILTSEGKISVFLKKFCPSFIDKMAYNKLSKEVNSPF